jgi:prolyl-tRNA synthetase
VFRLKDTSMRLSRYFLPVSKDTPGEASIVSHQLMLRAGMIKQQSAGIYSWLPLGLKVLKRIEQVVREEQDRSGALEILMPTVQGADLWRQSGRYDDYGAEMLRIVDRHERDLLYGPTAEEVVTDIFRTHVKSYRDLPLNLYNIQWKFRDEIRPRFGVMRGREFLMKDAYSFDLDEAGARDAYRKMFLAYLRTFQRLGLRAVPMRADTGPIGGDLSHEFVVLAPTGESGVFYDAVYEETDWAAAAMSFDNTPDARAAREAAVTEFIAAYAATDEMHDAAAFEARVAPERRREGRGIEVGHIFFFGDKYSKPMGATVTGPDGKEVNAQMGSYGIGVSRLAGAIIEASHDTAGIIWPDAAAPFGAGIINLKPGDAQADGACERAYSVLAGAGLDPLLDDTGERAGAKFATMDLIGLPWQLVIGPRGLANGVVELKRRATGERHELSLESALARLTA